ncbi:nucleotidyltransferase domain-containing protein [Catellatospora citrea]|uniref:nucleotidyltransferase domain-containing protein n=1 Tax=Catellatospora citrea TaxID=53366 RepID=UPI0033FC72C9
MGAYEDLLARAEADPAVRGVILTGSAARGMATVHSDHDVIVVVDERAGQWIRSRKQPALDEIVFTVDELADTSNIWERYAFRGARVLLDRLDGRIAALVHAQATLTSAETAEWSREYLDGYVNFIYRAAKNHRDGRADLARLEEMESVSWFLFTLFALHGRVRPYNKYLRWELETYPLGEPWDAATLPLRVADDPAGLFPDLEKLARERGHGDVLDAWGGELDLLR